MKLLVFLLVCVVFQLPTFGKVSADLLNQLADNYYKSNDVLTDNSCINLPDKTPCIKAICDKLSSFQCDEYSELVEVANACTGNYGAACFLEVISHLSTFEYDTRREAIQIAIACRNNVDGECIKYICQKIYNRDCDQKRELLNIAKHCQAIDR